MVIFFDIDGTLIDEESQIIPRSTVEAIAALRQRGHVPIINTGRPYTHIDQRMLDLPFAGCVCAGGMEILLNGQWLRREEMPRQLCRQVIDAVRRHKLQVIYEVEDGFILDGQLSTSPQCMRETIRMRQKGYAMHQVDDLEEIRIVKFVTFDAPGAGHEAFVKEMQPYFTCIERGGGMVEYLNKGCSKAQGMQQVLDALDVPVAESFAIGDSANDIAMFRFAGHAICMGNGVDEAKAAADFVTATVMEDGIYQALKHFKLI